MDTKPHILITGATGHIGFRTLTYALQTGNTVRITIRRASQSSKILSHPLIQPHASSLSIAHIPDMGAPAAFRAAMQDITHVLHIASPIALSPELQNSLKAGATFKDTLYDPAVNLTLEILRAAAATDTVRRVVITASGNCLAVMDGIADAAPTDFRPCPSPEAIAAVTHPGIAYKVSKILAVTATQAFMKEAPRGFDVVYTCPGYVQGAHMLAENLDEVRACTAKAVVELVEGLELGVVPQAPHVRSQIWVGDVARAHVEALTSARVKSDDVLVLAGRGPHAGTWGEVATAVREMFPEEVERGWLRPNVGQKCFDLPLDGKGTEEMLGWKFSPKEVWVREAVEQYLRLKAKERSTV